MRLSELPTELGIHIVRDGEFTHLGKTNHSKTKMLVFLENEEHLGSIKRNSDISCVLTTPVLGPTVISSLGVCVSDEPREAFYRLHDYLRLRTDFYGADFLSQIHSDVQVHPRAFVAPHKVRIGSGCIIEAGCTIMERTSLGAEVIIRAGATLGAEGLEFHKSGGRVLGVAHAGGLVLGDRVEIQNNTVVERAPYGGQTVVGEDTKVGCSALIAHNTQIGRRCLIAGGVTICGNVVIGDDVWIGPGAVISNGLTVHANARVTIGSVVARNVAAGATVTGNFAMDHQRFLKKFAADSVG